MHPSVSITVVLASGWLHRQWSSWWMTGGVGKSINKRVCIDICLFFHIARLWSETDSQSVHVGRLWNFTQFGSVDYSLMFIDLLIRLFSLMLKSFEVMHTYSVFYFLLLHFLLHAMNFYVFCTLFSRHNESKYFHCIKWLFISVWNQLGMILEIDQSAFLKV